MHRFNCINQLLLASPTTSKLPVHQKLCFKMAGAFFIWPVHRRPAGALKCRPVRRYEMLRSIMYSGQKGSRRWSFNSI